MFLDFGSVVARYAGWCYTLTITTSLNVIKSKLFKFELGLKIWLTWLSQDLLLTHPYFMQIKMRRNIQDIIRTISLEGGLSGR
jgi:hypothetical protein